MSPQATTATAAAAARLSYSAALAELRQDPRLVAIERRIAALQAERGQLIERHFAARLGGGAS